MLGEKLVYRLMYPLNVRAVGGDARKVSCPKPTGILQRTPNTGFPKRRQVLDLTEDSIVIQVTDVLLQMILHQVKARK
jgi:hypothetical protein